MTMTFKLYALARQRLTDLVTGLTARELYYIGGPEPLPAPLTAEEERSLLEHLPSDDGSIRRTLIATSAWSSSSPANSKTPA